MAEESHIKENKEVKDLPFGLKNKFLVFGINKCMIVHNMVEISGPVSLIRVTQKGVLTDQGLVLSTLVRLVRLEFLFERTADREGEAAVHRQGCCF